MISAEIPDENVDKGLYDIMVKNMIHGPCGAVNEKSTCMAKGRCTKQNPQLLVLNTIPATMVTHNIEADLLKMAVKQQ